MKVSTLRFIFSNSQPERQHIEYWRLLFLLILYPQIAYNPHQINRIPQIIAPIYGGGYERPKPGDAFPSPEEMLNRLNAVRSKALETIEVADEDKLKSNCNPDSGWEKTHADAYLRTIYHTIAHVRQIWLLRGALGMNDGISWSQQHWA